MKTPSVLAAFVLCLSLSAVEAARSQTQSADPINALAEKLRRDPRERATAGAALEKFLLDEDQSGRTFVAAGTDRAALSLFARDYAAKADPAALAILVYASAPGSTAEPRLRAALSAWSGPNQIRQASEKTGATAFLFDAEEQAKKVLDDPRVRADLSVEANNTTGVPVPGGPAALKRARQLRERGPGVDRRVFGEKQAQDLNGGGGAMNALQASAGAKAGDAGATAQASRSLVRNASAATIAQGANAPGAQLPRSQGRPDGIAVPAPGGVNGATGATPAPAIKQPDDGRVVPKEVSAWERVKESVSSPLSDAYGFTFAGLEPAPVSFRLAPPAMAYVQKASSAAFTTVTFYGHGAPGYMTVGEWGGDADDISNMLKTKMRVNATVELKGCNTSSIGGGSINPARGLSHLVRRVMYFSVPYLTGDRSEASREQLENDWDSDLARDVSIKLRGVKVCGFQTFGLVASRLPVVGTLMGNREATDSNAIGGSKVCYVNGVESK